MENNAQKWVSLSFLAFATLVAYVVFSLSFKLAGTYDLEARIRNIDLVIRGVSLLVGGLLFLILYRNDASNKFMNEVVVELSKVTWPAPWDTLMATGVVIVMVLISGMTLGLLDYAWTQLLKWVL